MSEMDKQWAMFDWTTSFCYSTTCLKSYESETGCKGEIFENSKSPRLQIHILDQDSHRGSDNSYQTLSRCSGNYRLV